jgi:hypothetical protein
LSINLSGVRTWWGWRRCPMTDRGVRKREPSGFEARMLPMLLEAVEENRVRPASRRSSTRARIRRNGAVAVVAATVVLATSVIVGGRTTIDVHGGDALADPDRVLADLRDAGIQARITAVPVDRPMAGTWWHLYFAPGVMVDELAWAKLKAQVGVGVPQLPEEIRDAGRGIYHHETLELPRNLPGPVTLVVGRERRPGEAEAPMDNELAPNGAFWCLHLEEMQPEQAGRVLEDLGYEVVWVYETFETPQGESRSVDEPPSGSGITTARFRSPSVVDVRLAPQAVLDELRLGEGTLPDGADAPSWAPEC